MAAEPTTTATIAPDAAALASEETALLAPLYPMPRLALAEGRGARVREERVALGVDEVAPLGDERLHEVRVARVVVELKAHERVAVGARLDLDDGDVGGLRSEGLWLVTLERLRRCRAPCH